MHIGLVGWGIETKSAMQFFGEDHTYTIYNEEPRDDFPESDNITIVCNNANRQPGLTSNSSDLSYLEDIDDCELIILSPTAKKPVEAVFGKNNVIWEKITTTMQLFFEQCQTENIIGITGTKGKGTTSTLIYEMLQEMGYQAHLAGNIGKPTLSLLSKIKKDDWIVLEMSNFQLYRFPYSPHIAVHLMMTEEHIAEWHKTMEDYVLAKQNICSHQKNDDIVIYHGSNEYAVKNAATSMGKKIPFMKPDGAFVKNNYIVIDNKELLRTDEVGLKGAHNLENICAAITAVWQLKQDAESIQKVVKRFSGLEHRLQTVRILNDVSYIDDSFGTTPDTAIVAMDAVKAPKVMIIGGHDKGSDYRPMIERLSQKDIRSIIGIGVTGKRIVDQLAAASHATAKLHKKDDFNNWTMQEIVELAQKEAQPGDSVILSTGSASFGIFLDYKDRGDQFIDAVQGL